MIRPVFWSAAALRDLDRSIAHVAERSALTAHRLLGEIREAVDRLEVTATGRRGRVAGTYEKVVAGRPFGLVYATRSQPAGGESIVILRVTQVVRDGAKREWPSAPAGDTP